MIPAILLYIVVFLYGIVIGSFLNVLIYRIPNKENIVTTRSHCMNCGYQLKWHDLVPLFSYLVLGGKCRKCKAHISGSVPRHRGTERSAVLARILEIWDERGFPSLLLVV